MDLAPVGLGFAVVVRALHRTVAQPDEPHLVASRQAGRVMASRGLTWSGTAPGEGNTHAAWLREDSPRVAALREGAVPLDAWLVPDPTQIPR